MIQNRALYQEEKLDMEPTIVDWKRVNPETDFLYTGGDKVQSQGLRSIKVSVKDPETGSYVPFIHQTPLMRLPFGITAQEIPNAPVKYKCDLSFPNVKKLDGTFHGDQELLDYLDFIKRVDAAHKKRALEQIKTWFKSNKKFSY